MYRPNKYRTHLCGELRAKDAGTRVRVAGWLHRKRDLGGLLFLVLRDHTGLVQVLIDPASPFHAEASAAYAETTLSIEGVVARRDEASTNKDMPTGEIEIRAEKYERLGDCGVIPFPVADETNASETERLKFRFLDLRRDRLQKNIALRAKVIAGLRRRMWDLGFQEFQTPILTSSSPEGARDFLVPSRVHPGKFYALPQAPQQFKQLLMVSGFPRYFQIAPCFRDEDARADRSPGEFYQLDLEMAYAEQDDVFHVVESVLTPLFRELSTWTVDAPPWPRIPYRESMMKYGSDKPDIRFGLEIQDVTEVFRGSEFKAFRTVVEEKGVVRAIPVPGGAEKSRKFFDDLDGFVKKAGGKGAAYVQLMPDGSAKGSIAKFLGKGELAALAGLKEGGPGSACMLLAGKPGEVAGLAGKLRLEIAEHLGLKKKGHFRFCWIVDFPMYEWNEEEKKVDFCHNPFSMPQGGMEALTGKDPLDILAYQYDVVCNGVELSSGAIRNHRPDIMYKAFEIAGYTKDDVERKFGGMLRAFQYGAPPHGGIAPGVDRIVMLLADEPNIREVICFPMTASAQDLLMGAPSEVTEKQLRELHIKVDVK